MEVSMKYRTQGSLPISAQHKAQYLPRIPEEPAPGRRGKAKLEAPVFQDQANEDRGTHPTPSGKVLAPPSGKVLAPPSGKVLAPPSGRVLVPPSTAFEPLRFRRPEHDPCKAIIETSPYYIYFKIVTTDDARKTQGQDLKSVLSELVVIDEDLPRTAKYRHFRSYEQ
ncbi:uncharacterized protein ACNLHF_023230 [Anomaloglossus baeobatrachus]